MALKSDRSTLQTDISFFMNEAATRGGVAVISTGGSGASMDNGSALVTYAAAPSGTAAVGLLMNDMVNIDLTRQHINQHKDEIQKGGKVTILRKGWVVTSNIEGSTTSLAGKPAFVAHSGNIAQSDIVSDDGQTHVIGRFLSNVDQDGYAKVEVNLPGASAYIPATGVVGGQN